MLHPTNRREFLLKTGALSMAGSLGSKRVEDKSDLRLWYREPAIDWDEALPIGNGRLGAMIFGGLETEHLQLNENTLYSEEPGRRDLELDIARDFDRVLALLRGRQYREADELVAASWLGRAQPCYQPMGDLYLYFDSPGELTGYTRELDLATAACTVSYSKGGAQFTRQYFASYPDQVIVIRLAVNRPKRLAFRADFDSVHPTGKKGLAGEVLVMTGQVPGFVLRRELEFVEKRGDQWKYPQLFDSSGRRLPHAKQVLYGDEIDGMGTGFEMRLRAIGHDGRLRLSGGTFAVEEASEVTLVLAARTSFNGFDKSPSRAGLNPERQAIADLRLASRKAFPALYRSHLRDYTKLFGRVSLSLGDKTEQSRLPTEQRIRQFANDRDPDLAALYFQFGRYLMISGSRPGGQPLNLQGLWNPHVIPPWAGAYTTNINAQMNYWPAEATNLSECHEPLFRMIRELSTTGAEVARKMYQRRGWVEHHNTTIWRDAQPVDNTARPAFWPMGGAWLCQHLWEHYSYTEDRDFLRDLAYPAIKGAAEFCSDWLVDDGQGRLVTAVGCSPEVDFRYTDQDGQEKTAGLSMGPTMDLAIIRELFANCIQASQILDCDSELRTELKLKLDKLLPYQIGSRGQLQEWREDVAETDPHHRHISHLYGLHPSNQIRRGTPELFKAARRTLEIRGDEGTGWALAWKINFWARLEDGNHAYTLVRNLIRLTKESGTRYDHGGVTANLLCSHPPFQIDGNFGGTAGMAEMLLQSHAGEIHLLPALPEAWPAGEVHGLCARGGFVVDIAWTNGRLTSAQVLSKLGKVCVVRYVNRRVELRTVRGKAYRFNSSLGEKIESRL